MRDEYIIIPMLNMDSHNIIQKMEKKAVPLKSLGSVNFGMQLRDRKKFPYDVTKDTSALTAWHKPCYTGKDIQRNIVHYNGLYCYFNREAKQGGCWDERAQLAKPKLLCRQIGRYPVIGIDLQGYPVLNTAFMISQFKDNLSPFVLLGILNSKPIRFYWMQKFVDNRKQFPKIKGSYLEQIPIKRNDLLEEKIEKLVHELLSALDDGASIEKLESRIDLLVYELYDITENDISIIEDALSEIDL